MGWVGNNEIPMRFTEKVVDVVANTFKSYQFQPAQPLWKRNGLGFAGELSCSKGLLIFQKVPEIFTRDPVFSSFKPFPGDLSPHLQSSKNA